MFVIRTKEFIKLIGNDKDYSPKTKKEIFAYFLNTFPLTPHSLNNLSGIIEEFDFVVGTKRYNKTASCGISEESGMDCTYSADWR